LIFVIKMAYSIDISNIVGGTAPITFYACDENGNNCTLLGTSPGVYILPTLLQSATTFMVKSIDNTGCIYFKLITCGEETYIILTELGEFLTSENGDILEFF
jgi:hypothetical protein